ncbi:transglycosylase family protein, partial [Kitasatospora sp. NPDC001159]
MPARTLKASVLRRTSAAAVLMALSVPLLAPTEASAASVATWDKVAACESSGNWSINTNNGYYGGLQISLDNWRHYGGLNYAPRPDLATKQQQILIAEKILADQGAGAWSCAPGTGLATDHTNPYPAPTPAPASPNHVYDNIRFANGTWQGAQLADGGAD